MTSADTYLRTATLVGQPDHVANVLITARDHGRLVRYSRPAWLPDGRVRVELVTREAVPAPRSRLHRLQSGARRTARRTARPVQRVTRRLPAGRRTWWTVAACTAAVAVVAGVLYLVRLAYLWVAAHFSVIVGLILLALIAAGLFSSAGSKRDRGCC